MAAPGKKYGLFIPRHPKKSENVVSANVFGDDEEEESSSTEKKGVTSKYGVTSNSKKAIKRQTQLDIDKALAEDPSVFEYDSVYDNMVGKKEEKMQSKKVDNKPRYIEQLLKASEKRKKEDERRQEKKIQKEREAEGEEFADKEVFVTSAYKKKMEERQAEEERERREAELEAKQDVTKQEDLSGFYRYILNETTKSSDVKEEAENEAKKVKEEQMSSDEEAEQKKSERKRAQSSSESDSDSDSNFDRRSSNLNDGKSTHREDLSFRTRVSNKSVYRKKQDSDSDSDSDRQRRSEKGSSSRAQEEEMPRTSRLSDAREIEKKRNTKYSKDRQSHYSKSRESRDSRSKDRDRKKSRSPRSDERKRYRSRSQERNRNRTKRHRSQSPKHKDKRRRSKSTESENEPGRNISSKQRKEERHDERELNVDGTGKSRVKNQTGKKLVEDDKENKSLEMKSKYARKTTDDEIEAARKRYLVRKLARERAKAGHSNDH